TFRGASDAGVLVEGGSDIVLQNCVVTANQGDGVRFAQSQGGLIFDTLIYGNPGAAVRLVESSAARVVNVTAFQNRDSGIVVTDSPDVFALNNIVNENSPEGIVVDENSTNGYQADFNLNTDGYGAGTPAGDDDIIGPFQNPLFVAPSIGVFHLAGGPTGSTSPAVDAGDLNTEQQFPSVLVTRTTMSDGTLDTPPVDLGYHYPPPLPT